MIELPNSQLSSKAVPDRLLSYRKAGELVGVSGRTVRAWVANGKLAAKRISKRCVRVWQSDVLLIAECASTEAAPPESTPPPEATQPTSSKPKWKGRLRVKPTNLQMRLLEDES